MHNKDTLLYDLQTMNLKPTDKVMIHSSMKSIGTVFGGADTVLDSFMEYFSSGLLMFPTHTWKTMSENHNTYNHQTEPSCVGLLTNMFMKRPNVYRSLHPTHSIAAYGDKACEYIKGEENFHTPTPPEGVWGRLKDINAKILLIGCTLKRNTFIHSIEERMDVPNRLTEKPVLFRIIMPDNTVKDNYMYRHYNAKYPHLSENFDKAEALLSKNGILNYHRFGSSKVMLMNAYDLSVYLEAWLKKDINLFSDHYPLL